MTELERVTTRWIVAACALTLVFVGIVLAMVEQHEISQWWAVAADVVGQSVLFCVVRHGYWRIEQRIGGGK